MKTLPCSRIGFLRRAALAMLAIWILPCSAAIPAEKERNSKQQPVVAPHNVERARGTYYAVQALGTVWIRAQGTTPQPGYQVFFEELPLPVYPPEFALWQSRPAGIAIQLMTPFTVWTGFGANDPIRSVVVHDAEGAHDVPVNQARSLVVTRRGGEGGVPFRHPGSDGPTPFLYAAARPVPFAGSAAIGSDGIAATTIADCGEPEIKMNIGAWLEVNSQFSHFRDLCDSGKLLPALSHQGNFTVFVPTTHAVHQFGLEAWNSLLADESSARNYARYHTVAGHRFDRADIENSRSLKMANGLQTWVHPTPRLSLRDRSNYRAHFRQHDVRLANGVVHVIDSVLRPEKQKYELGAFGDLWPVGTTRFTTAWQLNGIPLTIGGQTYSPPRLHLEVEFLQGSSTLNGAIQPDGTSGSGFDEFGEPTGTGPGIFAPDDVTFNEVDLEDPTGKGRNAFAVQGSTIEEELYFIVPTHPEDSFRLVIRNQRTKEAITILTLEIEREPIVYPTIQPGKSKKEAKPSPNSRTK